MRLTIFPKIGGLGRKVTAEERNILYTFVRVVEMDGGKTNPTDLLVAFLRAMERDTPPTSVREFTSYCVALVDNQEEVAERARIAAAKADDEDRGE